VKKEMLADGEYWATCRERNALSAAANGHSQVFPKARVVVKDGWATFFRDGKEVWHCHAAYAAANFNVQQA
jgi:archaeosine-15-forming tRNA-guanine transglycosylase